MAELFEEARGVRERKSKMAAKPDTEEQR